MSGSSKTFIDDSVPACAAADLNGILAENDNLILGSGQTLDGGNHQQTNVAAAVYAGRGDFYLDTGTGAAHVLGAAGAQAVPLV